MVIWFNWFSFVLLGFYRRIIIMIISQSEPIQTRPLHTYLHSQHVCYDRRPLHYNYNDYNVYDL